MRLEMSSGSSAIVCNGRGNVAGIQHILDRSLSFFRGDLFECQSGFCVGVCKSASAKVLLPFGGASRFHGADLRCGLLFIKFWLL